MKHKPRYRISASKDHVHIDLLDGHFWDNTIIDDQGTTALDIHIASVIQEIRAALYYLGTDTIQH